MTKLKLGQNQNCKNKKYICDKIQIVQEFSCNKNLIWQNPNCVQILKCKKKLWFWQTMCDKTQMVAKLNCNKTTIVTKHKLWKGKNCDKN